VEICRSADDEAIYSVGARDLILSERRANTAWR
jgi:hypothetical protein